MPGTLYVVATPIGNLEDITFRAVRVLQEVAVIAAEDTRRTGRLLQHYSISTPTTSLHEHNERSRSASLVDRLRAGDSIALVSDAGTPLISDPGVLLVATAHKAGIRVEPIPGPSAALAAVSASGLAAEQILFVGFPPSRATARAKWLKTLRDEKRLIVFYEAPHRIRATLTDLQEHLGDRLIAMARELTKAHEELVVSQISEVLRALDTPRGEYTVVVSPAVRQGKSEEVLPKSAVLLAEFGEITKKGLASSRRESVRLLADKYHVPPKAMYKLLEDARAR
jgi:16S rRNA (cytidine1402-2'-O)-methyltransferase